MKISKNVLSSQFNFVPLSRILVCADTDTTVNVFTTVEGQSELTPDRRAEKPECGWVGSEISDMKRRLSALCSRRIESSKFKFGILDLATVDVLGMCLYASLY